MGDWRTSGQTNTINQSICDSVEKRKQRLSCCQHGTVDLAYGDATKVLNIYNLIGCVLKERIGG